MGSAKEKMEYGEGYDSVGEERGRRESEVRLFFFKPETAIEVLRDLVGSEKCFKGRPYLECILCTRCQRGCMALEPRYAAEWPCP